MRAAIEISKRNAPLVAEKLGVPLGEVLKRVGKMAVISLDGGNWMIVALNDFVRQFEFIQPESAREFRQVRRL